jgi:hypothetical protein
VVLQALLSDPIVHEIVGHAFKFVRNKAAQQPVPMSPVQLGVLMISATRYKYRRKLIRWKASTELEQKVPDIRLHISGKYHVH